MNKNKTIRYAGAWLVACLFMAPACNKLDEKAYSLLAPSNYFTTKGDVTAALLGMYKPLQVCCGGYEQARNIMLNAASDEGNAIPPWDQYNLLTYTSSSGGEIADLWRVTYQSIGSANFVLDNQDKIAAVDPSDNKQFASSSLGEAKFMRGIDYFDLVRLYGGVPIRVRQATAVDADLPRSSIDSVYAQIIADLKYAEEHLPDKNDPGRPVKWTASAYLAKVYLTQKDYANALAEASKVIDNGPYSLQQTFAAIFDVNNKNNSEDIFDIQYTRQDGNGSRMEFLCLSPTDFFAAAGSVEDCVLK